MKHLIRKVYYLKKKAREMFTVPENSLLDLAALNKQNNI